jgi:hypothetical protein
MKILISAGELIDRGLWDAVCEMRGLNEWCVNEGLMDSNDELIFTAQEAKQLGLIPLTQGEKWDLEEKW